MEKINIVIISDDLDLRIEIKNLIDDKKYAISGFAGFGEEAKTKIISLFPEIVICAVRGGAGEKEFAFVQNLLSVVHTSMVVLATDSLSVEKVNRAAQYGIRKVMRYDGVSGEDFSKELGEVYELEQQRVLDTNEGKKVRCKVLGFFSGKGGTGKTTVAVNIATKLAVEGKRVMLVDLDLQFGDVSMALDFETKYSIVDLVQDRGGITIENVNNFSVEHSSGMSVLCAPKSSEFAEYVKPEHIEKIIDTMRPYYEYIIIDMATDFNDDIITACENCEEIYLVYTSDILSLRNSKICFDILDQLHQKDKLRFVLNRYEKGLIRPADFKKMFERDIDYMLPLDNKAAISSINKGEPVVLAQPRSPIAAALSDMTDSIIAIHSGVKQISALSGKGKKAKAKPTKPAKEKKKK